MTMRLPKDGRYDYVPLPSTSRTSSRFRYPHTFGYPFRLRPLRQALEHCYSHKFIGRVWKCRPGDIADYCVTRPPGTIP